MCSTYRYSYLYLMALTVEDKLEGKLGAGYTSQRMWK